MYRSTLSSNFQIDNQFNENNSRSVTYTQTRYIVKDFLKNFKKKMKENVEQDPEFGGDLKRLEETRSAVAETTKSTTSGLKKRVDGFKTTVQSSVQSSFEKAKNVTKESTDKLKEKVSPYYDEVAEEAKKVVDTEKIKKSTETITKTFQETTEKAREAVKSTTEKTEKIMEPVSKTLEHTKKSVSESKIVKDIGAINRATKTKNTFNPTPEKPIHTQKKHHSTSLVISRESTFSKFKENISRRWNEIGDSDSRLSYLVDAVESWAEKWRRISSSPMGIMVSNIKKEYPEFEIDSFQEWVTRVLVPKVLTGKNYDDFVKTHSGDLIKQLYKTKKLPLPYRFINMSHTEIFPGQDQDLNNFRFFFKIQGQAREIDKKTQEKKIYNVILILSTKLNEDKVWILTEYQELEKTEALF